MRSIEKALADKNFDAVIALLVKLKGVEVTVDLLADTGVGKFVNKLKKCVLSSEEVNVTTFHAQARE